MYYREEGKSEIRVSQVAACNWDGKVEFLPISENHHINNILHTSKVPATISNSQKKKSRI